MVGDSDLFETDLSCMYYKLIDSIKPIRKIDAMHMEVATVSWVEYFHD